MLYTKRFCSAGIDALTCGLFWLRHYCHTGTGQYSRSCNCGKDRADGYSRPHGYFGTYDRAHGYCHCHSHDRSDTYDRAHGYCRRPGRIGG